MHLSSSIINYNTLAKTFQPQEASNLETHKAEIDRYSTPLLKVILSNAIYAFLCHNFVASILFLALVTTLLLLRGCTVNFHSPGPLQGEVAEIRRQIEFARHFLRKFKELILGRVVLLLLFCPVRIVSHFRHRNKNEDVKN